jgi:protein-L-isoaspartate(D-aspartate) O-methyltransferase
VAAVPRLQWVRARAAPDSERALEDFREQRRRLVDELRSEGIRDERVLAAIGRVPREQFVGQEQLRQAYRNSALPIAEGQTISQPFVVALMTCELDLSGHERVLEVGTGSGYQTAILAELADLVVSVERHASLLRSAGRVLTELGYVNVELHESNGSLGWPRGAPYDRIIVTAAAPSVPEPLIRQLGEGGRMVIPVGAARQQELVVVATAGGAVRQRRIGPVRFVPLVGDAAWHLE